MDKEELLFGSKMIDVVEGEFNANCDNEEAEEFVSFTYEAYKREGSPPNVKQWLKKYLNGAYLCVGNQPEWVEGSPNWPYLNGKPMVFITQYRIPKNQITEKHLTWDVMLYVFGQRISLADGYKVEYRMVEQIIGIDEED
jgi:hypothetical protein